MDLWELIMSYLSNVTILKLSAVSYATFLSAIIVFREVVQGIKKVMESLSKWEWLLKHIPWLGKIFELLAHDFGPMVINILLTGSAMLMVALEDQALTVAELINIVVAIVGTDVLYRLTRKWLYPKVS